MSNGRSKISGTELFHSAAVMESFIEMTGNCFVTVGEVLDPACVSIGVDNEGNVKEYVYRSGSVEKRYPADRVVRLGRSDISFLDILKERQRKSDKANFYKELLKCEICGHRVPALYPRNGDICAYCAKHIDSAPVGSAVYSSEKYGYIVALDGDGESVLIMDFDWAVEKWC